MRERRRQEQRAGAQKQRLGEDREVIAVDLRVEQQRDLRSSAAAPDRSRQRISSPPRLPSRSPLQARRCAIAMSPRSRILRLEQRQEERVATAALRVVSRDNRAVSGLISGWSGAYIAHTSEKDRGRQQTSPCDAPRAPSRIVHLPGSLSKAPSLSADRVVGRASSLPLIDGDT